MLCRTVFPVLKGVPKGCLGTTQELMPCAMTPGYKKIIPLKATNFVMWEIYVFRKKILRGDIFFIERNSIGIVICVYV